MFGNKPRSRSNQIGSLIGAGTRIVGTIRFVGGLRIDGEIQGDVTIADAHDGTLVLGEQARVEGKLTAPQMLINGTVTGQTISTEFVELQPHAQINGNIYYKDIAMCPGAKVDGRLVHCRNKESGDLELVYDAAPAPSVPAKPVVRSQEVA